MLLSALRERGASVRLLAVGGDIDISLPDGLDSIRLEMADAAIVADEARTFGAHVVVVDSYALRGRGLEALGAEGLVRVVIDDLADEALDVEIVLNPSLDAEQLPYERTSRTVLLLGALFALLPPGLAEAPQPVRRSCARVLVTMGGSDPRGLTMLAARAAHDGTETAFIDVVFGPYTETRTTLDTLRARPRARIIRSPELRELMRGADLAISAGGQTTYELAAARVPMIAIATAQNQCISIAALERHGAILRGPEPDAADLESRLCELVRRLDRDPDKRSALIDRAATLVDGGGARRAAEAILSYEL